MKPEEIEKVASLMEATWSNSYYKKDHKSLVGSITIMMADCSAKDMVDVIKDYAFNYDNVPTLATIARLLHKKEAGAVKAKKGKRPICIEDIEGYVYMLGPDNEYDCIWRPSMANHGKTKMETLKKYGLTDY